MIIKLFCWLGIHEVPQYRHPTGIWLWGSSVWSRNADPFCIQCGKGRK